MSGVAIGTRIRLADNTFKYIEDLKSGDEVLSVNIVNGVEYIDTDIVSKILVHKCKNDLEKLVKLGNLRITPYHKMINFGIQKVSNIKLKKSMLTTSGPIYSDLMEVNAKK